MKNSDKVLIGIGIGLLAGGVAGYFLATEEGQKMQMKAKENLKKLSSDAQKVVKEQSEVIGDKLSTAANSAKSWVDEAATAVKNKISNTTEAAEDVVDNLEDSFQDGVAKARRNIREQSNTIDNVVDNA